MFISSYEVICSSCGTFLRDGEQEKAEYCEGCKPIENELKGILKNKIKCPENLKREKNI